MKLIVDIPEVDYNYAKQQVADGITNPLKIFIASGTPIPDNATNGDVIKAMFKPNRITRTDDDIVHIDYDFTTEWWNALYKKGGKE